MNIRLSTTIALVFGVGILALSANPLMDLHRYNRQMENMHSAAAKWRAAKIDDYDLQIVIDAFRSVHFDNPLIIQVRDSRPISVTDADFTRWSDLSEFSKLPLTVNEFFETIASILESDPKEFSVTYDGTYGYPRSISVDFSPLTHDEYAYAIKWVSIVADDV
jgi:Family of unknown function (DUF6174)